MSGLLDSMWVVSGYSAVTEKFQLMAPGRQQTRIALDVAASRYPLSNKGRQFPIFMTGLIQIIYPATQLWLLGNDSLV